MTLLFQKTYIKNPKEICMLNVVCYSILNVGCLCLSTHLQRKMSTELLDYVSLCLRIYFQEKAAYYVPPPVGVVPEYASTFCLMQLRALQQMGLVLQRERLRTIFSPVINVELEYFPPMLPENDGITRLFVDLQGSVEKPQELAIIVARGLEILNVHVWMGVNRNPTFAEKRDRKFGHGLPKSPGKAITKVLMLERLSQMIEEKDPAQIVVGKMETRKFVQRKRDRIVLVQFRKWRHRPANYAYHAAMLAKAGRLCPELANVKDLHNHTKFICNNGQCFSQGEVHKREFGYQCAVYGTLELMHFHLANPNTKLLVLEPLQI